MLQKGTGFFSMWNGVPPELAEDFSAMHARDHLVEHMRYLGPDEIGWARRYTSGAGTLPPYFAWYAMRSLDVLVSPAYANCAPVESEWFKKIRPRYRDRIGHHCDVVASAGAGVGGSVGTMLVNWGFDLSKASAEENRVVERLIVSLTRREPIVAAHLGSVNWHVPSRVGGKAPTAGPDDTFLAVLILESFDRHRLALALAELSNELLGNGTVKSIRGLGRYNFSYGLAPSDLPDVVRL